MKTYSKYKDTNIEWLGEIPEHWEIKKLKFISDIVLGKMLTNVDKGDYLYKPYLRAQNINWLKVNVEEVKSMWFSMEELRKFRISLNDLLVSEGGEVGRTCIWQNEIDECYIQNSVHKVTFKNEFVPAFFLNQFFVFGFKGVFDSITNKISIGHLTGEKLKEVFFTIPSFEEQQTITRFLNIKISAINTLISKKEKLIELLKEERTAIIKNAVTKGINSKVKMKDSGVEWLGEIPEHWEVKKLKFVLNVNENVISEKTDKEFIIKYIDIGNVSYGGLIKPPEEIMFGEAPSRARRITKRGDTILSTVRTYLKAISYIEDDFDNLISSTGFAVITPTNKFVPKYVFYLLSCHLNIEFISYLSKGVSYPAIDSFDLSNIKIALPPISEQNEILDYLENETDKIYKAITTIEKEIELIKEYRTALISEAVTGKIDLRNE